MTSSALQGRFKIFTYNMKKLLLPLLIALTFTISAKAQTTEDTGKFNIGLEFGVPVGRVSQTSNAVVGASLKYELPASHGAFYTFSAGYNSFLTKGDLKAQGAQGSVGYVPLKVGIKVYAESGFFLEGQLGYVFSTEQNGSTGFAYSPGFGYSFGTFELGFRYEGWPKYGVTTSQFGFRLGVKF